MPSPPNRKVSNLFHHTPINVEPFTEKKFHGFDEDSSFELLAARDNVRERHAGTNLK